MAGRKKKVIDPEKQTLPIQGAGDIVGRMTDFFGIKKCVGCKNRENDWNKMFPFLKPKRELTEEEIEIVERVTIESKFIDKEDKDNFFNIYNEVFNSKIQRCDCPGLIKTMLERLNVLKG